MADIDPNTPDKRIIDFWDMVENIDNNGLKIVEDKMIYKNIIENEKVFEIDKYFNECHASTLLVLDDDEIIAAWFAGTHEKHPDVAIWSARRENGKWSEPVKIADMEGVPCWNPVLFRGQQGRIFLYYKVGKTIPNWYTMYMVSEDNGCTWSEPKELVEGDIGGRGPVKNKPIILKNGDWAAPASVETETEWDAFCDISKDRGESWLKSCYVPIDHNELQGKGIIQPSLWESEPGKLHMLLRSTEGCIYRSDSYDGGVTWREAYPTDLANNNSGLDFVKMDSGSLVLIHNPVSGNWAERTPISCSISKDNGLTWGQFILEHSEIKKHNFFDASTSMVYSTSVEFLKHVDNQEYGKRKTEESNRQQKYGTKAEFSYPAVVAKHDCVYITYTWNRKTISFWKIQII